jgi:hypothetical protein
MEDEVSWSGVRRMTFPLVSRYRRWEFCTVFETYTVHRINSKIIFISCIHLLITFTGWIRRVRRA